MAASQTFIEHSRRAEYSLESACDRESVVVRLTGCIFGQHCHRKGSTFRLVAANYRYAYQQYFVPNVPNFIKIFYYLPIFTAPYFFAVLPLAILNIYIVYRVAKESRGVLYHLAQAIGDILILIHGLLSISGATLVFAPLFAFVPFCQFLVEIIFFRFAVFWHNFSLLSMVLLWQNRYISLCLPQKYAALYTRGRVRKSLLRASALAVVPASLDSLKLFSLFNSDVVDNKIYDIASVISDGVQLLYCTVCISLIIFYWIQTAKYARVYKPPEGASNFAETEEMMKRFYRLTVQVLALNAAMIFMLFLFNLLSVASQACMLMYNASYYIYNAPLLCITVQNYFYSTYYLTNWSPHLTVFTSNIGLLVHSIFSRAYRNEVVKVLHEFMTLIRVKNTASIFPG